MIVLCALLQVTCDKKITRALPVVSPCDLNESNSIVKTNATATNLNIRKVLLEDYTGHFCGNCPRAAEKAETIEQNYGEKVVVLANHVTDIYALPQSDTLYKENFMNAASTGWDGQMKISSAPGLPRGAVNRIESTSGTYALAHNNWEAAVTAELAKPQSARLVLTSYYNPTSSLVKVKVTTTFLKALTGNYNVIVALTEDSIVADQKDYFPPAGSVVVDGDVRPDYVFNNLVLGSANGVDGQLVKASPLQSDTATVVTPCYALNNCFYKNKITGSCDVTVNDKHVYAVAFLVDAQSHEVLQVEKLKIR